jgi:hypothetical protein
MMCNPEAWFVNLSGLFQYPVSDNDVLPTYFDVSSSGNDTLDRNTICRVRNKQLSESWKGMFDLIDYFLKPSTYLWRFNSYLERQVGLQRHI